MRKRMQPETVLPLRVPNSQLLFRNLTPAVPVGSLSDSEARGSGPVSGPVADERGILVLRSHPSTVCLPVRPSCPEPLPA